MVKDIRYIIKRIIIGVGIAICMYFFRNYLFLNAYALSVSPGDVGPVTWSVNPTDNYWYVNKSINDYWSNWGSGYIYFNIGISKRSFDSVAPLVSPKSITLSSGSVNFPCSIGSNSVNNSTYVNQNYSVVCPVNLTNNHGLTLMTVNLMPLNNTPVDIYEIYFDGYMSFVADSEIKVNVDSSATTGAINNQTQSNNNNRDQNFGNLIDDNRVNAKANNDNRDANTKKITDAMTNDDTTEANSKGTNFFNNFQSDSHGLSGIITAPLRLLNSMLDSTCSPLTFPLPFVNNNVNLPCMSSIYNLYPTFWNIWKIITDGLIGYWVVVKIFAKIKDFQNPNNDRIEVLDL